MKQEEALPREHEIVFVAHDEYSARDEYEKPNGYAAPNVTVRWEADRHLLVDDNPNAAGREVLEARKHIDVADDWFRSEPVAIHYAGSHGSRALKK